MKKARKPLTNQQGDPVVSVKRILKEPHVCPLCYEPLDAWYKTHCLKHYLSIKTTFVEMD